MIDQTRFQNLCKEHGEREKLRDGIGTLSEKTTHAVLKDYMDSNPAHQEQPLAGYVADIYDGSAVVEIQTKAFYRLRKKLETFLPVAPVTVVHPLQATRYLNWVDPDTGEITGRRKQHSKPKPWDAMEELYGIKTLLKEPDLHFHFFFLNWEEYRLLDGYGKDRKVRGTKVEKVPVSIEAELLLDKPEDYRQFLPKNLPKTFTSKDFKKAAGIPQKTAQTTLNVLNYVGIVQKVGKDGRLVTYEVCDGEAN